MGEEGDGGGGVSDQAVSGERGGKWGQRKRRLRKKTPRFKDRDGRGEIQAQCILALLPCLATPPKHADSS